MQKIKELITHCGKKIPQYRTTGQLQSITKTSKVPSLCVSAWGMQSLNYTWYHNASHNGELIKTFLYLKFKN